MKANITDTPLCDLVLVVDGREGDTLDLGGRAKRATHCAKLCLGGREGRKGNLQGQGNVYGVISEPTLGGYPGVWVPWCLQDKTLYRLWRTNGLIVYY